MTHLFPTILSSAGGGGSLQGDQAEAGGQGGSGEQQEASSLQVHQGLGWGFNGAVEACVQYQARPPGLSLKHNVHFEVAFTDSHLALEVFK